MFATFANLASDCHRRHATASLTLLQRCHGDDRCDYFLNTHHNLSQEIAEKGAEAVPMCVCVHNLNIKIGRFLDHPFRLEEACTRMIQHELRGK